MHAPTLKNFESLAEAAVASRRGWSGPIGMTMTAGPPEPDAAAAAAAAAATAAAAAEQARKDAAAGGEPKEAVDDAGRGLGFPADTPTEKMNDGQRAAYWRNQSRVQEKERRAWETRFAGKKPEEVEAALAELAKKNQTEAEQALEAARKEGLEQGQKLGVTTSGEDAAMLLLETHLEHRLPDDEDKDRRKILAESVNIKTAIGEDGKVDPVRVKAIADALAPSGVTPGTRTRQTRTTTTDVGGAGRTAQTGTGVAAGRSLFTERHGKRGKQDDE